MVNPEHLEILKRGVEAWNKWREENRRVGPDHGGAHHWSADLRRANLEGAYLWHDDLGNATVLRSRLAANFTGWEPDNAKSETQLEKVVRA